METVNHQARSIGVVVIGRNEGERLKRCLASLAGRTTTIVYVDSGSDDGSIEHARSVGAEVVELDLSEPFTAARARNAGFRRLLELEPSTEFVQFVDGDCEVQPAWIEAASTALDSEEALGAVAGRQRERFPDATIYNTLFDIEWNAEVGEAEACAGNAMMRVEAVSSVGGYDPSIIAAEDDDLCVRMRGKGWTIRRISAEMVVHDAAMTSVKQWWKRAERCGHAFGQVHDKHRDGPLPHFRREHRGVILWGGVLPAVSILLAPFYGAGIGLLLVTYGAIAWRVMGRMRKRGYGLRLSWVYGIHCAAAKVPQFVGLARWKFRRWRNRQATIIEYKGPVTPTKQLS